MSAGRKRWKCVSFYAIRKTKTNIFPISTCYTPPPHFRAQYRLGNVVQCYREALAGLEGGESCNHLDLIGYSRFYINLSFDRIIWRLVLCGQSLPCRVG